MLRLTLLCITILSSLCFLVSNVEAQMSQEAIASVRQLPIDKELQDEFIENFDAIIDFIVNGIMAPPSAGRASIECLGCRVLMKLVIELMRIVNDINGIKALLQRFICPVLNSVLHQDVCIGALELYAEDVHFIMKNHLALKPLDVCGVILGRSGNCPPISANLTDWKIELPPGKPTPIYENEPYLADDVIPVKILHLTDIHLDLDYMIGKNTDCGKPMCCQNVEDDGLTPETSAGVHGDYHCDMPLSAMEELFETSAKDTYEFVMMTGDIPPHNIWNTTIQGNLDHYKAANDKLIQLFYNEKGIKVYPVIGNHEPHPCNLFPPKSVWDNPLFDKAWMYDALAEDYELQINDTVASDQFKIAGYYTIKHKNLRLVVINTNLCYTLNFWLYYDLQDPQGQLQWLAETLAAAEAANEPVYILGHVPPGSGSCWTHWSEKFEEIVIRYESTIKAQFYGHTHNDETAVFFDSSEDPPRPANSYFIGVSTTPHTNINPGYKVFYADGGRGDESTWEIMDHETFIYNLTEANNAPEGSELPWRSLYKAKETFGLKSFRPRDLYDMAYRMLFDDTLFQSYWTAYQKDSHTKSKCTTEECMLDYVCDIVIANSGDYSHCEQMQKFHQDGTTPVPTTRDPSATTPVPTTPVSTTTAPTTPAATTPGGGGSYVQPITVTLFLLVTGVVLL